MHKNKGITFVLIGAASFGFTPIFAKLAFSSGYSLGQLNIAQMIIAFLSLWAITLIKRSKFKGLTKKNIGQIMLTGTFVGLTTVFYYGSIQYLPASIAIILLFQFVWIGIIFEWLFAKIKPTIVTLGAVILILTGVFFASNILGGTIQDLPITGIVLGVMAAFCYAGFIFFSGKVAISVDPWIRSSLMITGSLVLVLLIFIREVPMMANVDGRLWLIATGVALFGSIFPPLFYALGAHLLPDGLATILTSVELPVALISASLILSEEVTGLQWAGVLLIVVAICLNEVGGTRLRYNLKNPAP